MATPSTVAMLYSRGYGGAVLSDKAVAEYNRRCTACDPSFKPDESVYGFPCARSDEVMIAVVRELGKDAVAGRGRERNALGIAYFQAGYACCAYFYEYDGKETPYYDMNRHRIHKALDICDAKDVPAADKIELIREALAMQCPQQEIVKEEI